MVSLLFFLLVSNLSTYVRGECGLAEWTVRPPADGDVSVDLNDDGNKINIKYKAVNQLYKVNLYNRCDIPNGRTELADTLMTVATADAPDADECKDIDATLTMMVAELEGSDIYKDIAGTTTGEINFCTELVLLLPDDSGVSASFNGVEQTSGVGVTFHQLNTTVNVDFLNGFQITSVNLVYDQETISTTDKIVDYGITSCQCSEDGTCHDDETTVEEAKISQSKNLFLCFEVTAPDIVIKHVSLIDFTQGTQEDSNELRLNAVSAAETWNALTTVVGEATQKVQVTSRLIELFFRKIDLPVTASGSLVLDFQSNAARKLQQVAFNVPSRKLADTVDFSVENISLELDTGSAVATSTLYMLFIFVPIVLLF